MHLCCDCCAGAGSRTAGRRGSHSAAPGGIHSAPRQHLVCALPLLHDVRQQMHSAHGLALHAAGVRRPGCCAGRSLTAGRPVRCLRRRAMPSTACLQCALPPGVQCDHLQASLSKPMNVTQLLLYSRASTRQICMTDRHSPACNWLWALLLYSGWAGDVFTATTNAQSYPVGRQQYCVNSRYMTFLAVMRASWGSGDPCTRSAIALPFAGVPGLLQCLTPAAVRQHRQACALAWQALPSRSVRRGQKIQELHLQST